MDEYFCPECGAILNDQYGFNPDGGTWTCTECGKMLMDEETYDGEVYEGVAWFCDSCDALLNKQFGFSDEYTSWTCTECYHTNEITEDNIYNSKEEYYDNKSRLEYEEDDDDYDDYDEDNEEDEDSEECDVEYDNSSYSTVVRTVDNAKRIYYEKQKEADMLAAIRKEDKRIDKEKKRAWRRKHRKGLVITTLAFFTCLSILIIYIVYNQLIPIRYNYKDLVGTNFTTVVEKLNSSGFFNIDTMEISDLKISEENNDNIVTDIIIKNKKDFSEDTKIFPNEKITVVYHTLKKFYAPLTSKAAKGKQYKDVISQFENNGFLNIKTNVIYDIITGWIKSDGEIESITINGDEDFSKFKTYREDAEIVITYHTLKKNRPK